MTFYPVLSVIKIAEKNFELLTFIRNNKKLYRKELVQKIVEHPNFIFADLKRKKTLAWELVQKAKKSTLKKSYEVKDTNGGIKNGIWICHFDFTSVYAR